MLAAALEVRLTTKTNVPPKSYFDAIRIWEVATGKEVLLLKEQQGYVHEMAWSPDGRCIISAGHDTMVRVWEAATGNTYGMYEGHTGPVKALACSPDGQYIASAGNDTAILVHASSTGNLEGSILPGENVAGFLGALAQRRGL